MPKLIKNTLFKDSINELAFLVNAERYISGLDSKLEIMELKWFRSLLIASISCSREAFLRAPLRKYCWVVQKLIIVK